MVEGEAKTAKEPLHHTSLVTVSQAAWRCSHRCRYTQLLLPLELGHRHPQPQSQHLAEGSIVNPAGFRGVSLEADDLHMGALVL